MHPTGTKEEAEKIAAKLPIRHARRTVVRNLLKFFFTYHHPRLYPRINREGVIRKCTSEMTDEYNPCGTLVTIHNKHPDADAARRDVYCE